MKKVIVIVFVFALSFFNDASAQQDPQYTQYMYNHNVMNPAYAGSLDNLQVTLLYRNQWTGFDGAPKTGTFSGHSPVGEKTGLGLSVISDKHGPVKETNLYADFSYTLDIGGENKLAFGIKGGLTLHDIGLLTDVSVIDAGDPFFSQNVSKTNPNIGAGAFFYSDKYYVGLSVPNMLKGVHLDENGTKFGSEELHYFLTAGYVFQLTENTKLKPSFMIKSSFDAPVSFDVNANFLFFDKFGVGASYRLEDSVSGLVSFAFNQNIKLGYAYDHIVSDISSVASSSHEFLLQFDLNFPRKVSRSPRFF